MIMRKESREKQDSNFATDKATRLHPQPSINTIDTFLLGKDNEKKICNPQSRLLSNYFRIKVKGKLAEMCLNSDCIEIIAWYVDFRAETENRAKTFELAFENNLTKVTNEILLIVLIYMSALI